MSCSNASLASTLAPTIAFVARVPKGRSPIVIDDEGLELASLLWLDELPELHALG